MIMAKKLKVYDMVINEHDETGMDINSFVYSPAHIRSFEMYDKRGNKVMFKVDEEKRIVTGVFIQANFHIYRNDKQLGEHFVKFSPEMIEKIRNKFFLKGFQQNTNIEHGPMVQGAVLVESYIVDSKDPKRPNVPEILARQKVNDGSWIGSYFIENDALWQDCKNGIFKGFSIEGYFDKVVTNKTHISMSSKKKKGIFKSIFGDKEEMGEAQTVDGIKISWEGDLKEGTAVKMDQDGEMVVATGDHQVTIEDVTYALTLDAEGKVTSMEAVEEMSDEGQALVEAMAKIRKKTDEAFAAMEENFNNRIQELEDQLESVSKGEKFSRKNKKSGDTGERAWTKLV